MYDIIELNAKKVPELKEIAKKLGVARAEKLKKQDLVYSILDEQAMQPATAKKAPAKAKKDGDAPKPNAPLGEKKPTLQTATNGTSEQGASAESKSKAEICFKRCSW